MNIYTNIHTHEGLEKKVGSMKETKIKVKQKKEKPILTKEQEVEVLSLQPKTKH